MVFLSCGALALGIVGFILYKNVFGLDARLRAHVMEHHEDIEAEMRMVYNEYAADLATWEKYKDSKDEEFFAQAIAARDRLICEDGDLSYHNYNYYGVKLAWIKPFFGHDPDIVIPALTAVDAVFWGGKTPLTDLPQHFPDFTSEKDFPNAVATTT